VTGETTSSTFPTTPGATNPSGIKGFIAKANPTGTHLVYSTLVGMPGNSVAVDGVSNAYLTDGGTALVKFTSGPPACAVAALIPGPPARLKVVAACRPGSRQSDGDFVE
jgi:hypothetical protein